MPEKRLGLEIRKDGVSAVVVKRGLSSSHVAACINVPANMDMNLEDALAEALTLAEARAELAGAGVTVSFSDAPVNFRNVSFPFSEMKKVRQILGVELETQAPLRAEDIVADIHVLEKTDGIVGIAAYMPTSIVSGELNLLSANELAVDHLGVAPFTAALAFLDRYDSLPACGIFLWASSQSAVAVCFADNAPIFARRIEGPFGQRLARLSGQVGMTVRAVSDTWAPSFAPQAIFVTGSALGRPDFAETLAERTGLEVRVVDLLPETGMAVSADEAEDYSPHIMDSALALALFPPTDTSGFNLRQGPFAVTHQWERFRGELAHVGILALCLFLMVCFNYLTQVRLLSQQARRIASANAAMAAGILPGLPPGENPVKALEDKVAGLSKGLDMPDDAGASVRVMDVLKAASERVASDTDIRLSNITVSGEGVQMSGEADSISSVDTVQSRLEKTPPFDKVTIVSTDIDKRTGRVNFRLRCQFPADKGSGQEAGKPEGDAQ